MKLKTRVLNGAVTLIVAGILVQPLGVFGPGNDDDRPLRDDCTETHILGLHTRVVAARTVEISYAVGDHYSRFNWSELGWRREFTTGCRVTAHLAVRQKSSAGALRCWITQDGVIVARQRVNDRHTCEVTHEVS